MTKLIILDRDGVINADSDAYIKTPAEWHPIPGSMEAIARLNQQGYRVAIATNQAGVARGLFTMDGLNAIHHKLHQTAQACGAHIDAIFFCPHATEDNCDCRKPKPGMLEQIAAHYAADLAGIWFVGDTGGDLQAALAVDCQPVLVKTGKGERTLAKPLPPGTRVFDDLAAVADQLLS
jgi:D-glycero-D-manno-heptose 1,7-bisphosphate phosphatase